MSEYADGGKPKPEHRVEAEFTASNGHVITKSLPYNTTQYQLRDKDGQDMLKGYSHLTTQDLDALGEYWQAVKDEALNRWRCPADPKFLVYLQSARLSKYAIRVVNEANGDWVYYNSESQAEGDGHAAAARAYYAQLKPDPLALQIEKVGGGWATIVQYTPGDESQVEDARDKAEAFGALGFKTRRKRLSELKDD